MDWKQLAPFLVPVLVVALFARRMIRAQQHQPVRIQRLWIIPAILLVLTGLTLAREPAPSLPVILAFVLAAAAGGAVGWYRVHTLEFTVDPETGAVLSRATPFGALLLVGLLIFRYGMKYVLTDEGVRGVDLVHWTDGALLFTAAMLTAQSAHTWVRARKVVPVPATAPDTKK